MEIVLDRRRDPRRTTRRLVNAVAGFVAVLALCVLVPAAMGLERAAVADRSLGDAYAIGTLVLTEDVPVESLRTGDVVALPAPAGSGVSGPVVRRIGVDAVDAGDGSVPLPDGGTAPAGERVERVVAHVPFLGWPFVALGDRATRIAAIGLPALLVAAYAAQELVGGLRRRRLRDRNAAEVDVPAQRSSASRVGKHPDGVL